MPDFTGGFPPTYILLNEYCISSIVKLQRRRNYIRPYNIYYIYYNLHLNIISEEQRYTLYPLILPSWILILLLVVQVLN